MKKLLLILLATLSSLALQAKYISYTDTITVNGVSLFYAVEGKGRPVLLLHGNGGSHCDLETTMRQLAQKGYLVYALDSRGQGANTRCEEYHYRDMAEDTYQFIQRLGLGHPAIFGWSDGGIVALQLEVMHPGTLSLIVASGANITVEDALDEGFLNSIRGDGKNLSPLTKMIVTEPNMTAEDMQSIQCPTLICAGEHDIILPQHTRMIADNIPHSTLYIVPGATHGSHIHHSRQIGDIILRYFLEHKY